jgi:nicotinamide riboside kinase
MVGMAAIDAANSRRLTVAVVGAECSGKTTLAEGLARRFDTACVPEFSREYLAARASYDQADVLAIAKGQHAAEVAAGAAQSLLIADTDLVVIKVWWEVRYGGTHPWLDATLAEQLARERRCYLLPRPDIPWAPDPLREHPNDRPALHARYRALLDSLGVDYLEVGGTREERLARAAAAIEGWLSR